MKKRKILLAVIPALIFTTSCGNEKVDETNEWPTISVDSDGTWIIDGKDTNVDSNGYKFEDIAKVEETEVNGESAFVLFFSDGSQTTVTFKVVQEDPHPDNDDEEEPFVNELTAQVLDNVSNNLKMKGNLTRTFNGLVDETYSLEVDVAYNDDAYYYSSTAKDGTKDEVYLYKRAGRTQMCVLGLDNKKVYEDLQGAVWEDYRNPFLLMRSKDFTKSTQNPDIFELNVEDTAAETIAINFLTNTTRYTFKGLDKFSLTMEKGEIVSFDVVTSEAGSFSGSEQYTIHFDLVAKDDEVEDINGPYVNEKKPEHEKLREAFKELADNDLVYTYKIFEKSNTDKDWNLSNPSLSEKIYISNDLYFYNDLLNNVGGGFIIIDGDSYLVSSQRNQYVRTCYPYFEDNTNNQPVDIIGDFKQLFDVASPEIFTVIDDKHFELNGALAGVFGYYYDPYYTEESYYTTKATVELDDNYHVKTITYSDSSTLYVEEFLEIGNISHPFTLDELQVGEDTFLPFVHTYSYTGEDKLNHSIVIKDAKNITIDGVQATGIIYNMRSSQVTFDCGELTYILRYDTSTKAYSLSIKSYSNLAYYELFEGASLIIA